VGEEREKERERRRRVRVRGSEEGGRNTVRATKGSLFSWMG
jgi:hypothetical protein